LAVAVFTTTPIFLFPKFGDDCSIKDAMGFDKNHPSPSA
jgi:hypothetical protein